MWGFQFCCSQWCIGVTAGTFRVVNHRSGLINYRHTRMVDTGIPHPAGHTSGQGRTPHLQRSNGNWFIWVVGAQSVAVLAASLEPKLIGARSGLSMTAVFAWSLGVILYLAIAVFVVLRMITYPLDPHEFKPPYWESMGALAISILARSHLAPMTALPLVDLTGELITGIAVVFWCVATWMIPALFGIGIWRHFIRKVPLVYEPSLWSLVFPLGMYSAASGYLGQANDLAIIQNIGSSWLWVAVAAWLIT